MSLLKKKATIRSLIRDRELAETALIDARHKRDQETKSLKAERQQARTAAAVALVTGDDAPDVPTLPDEAKLDATEDRLALAVTEAEKAVSEAKLAEWEMLQRGLPGLAKKLQWACRLEREALAQVGSMALRPYQTLLKAQAARGEAEAEVYEAQRALKKSSGGDARVNAAQIGALSHLSRDARTDATSAEIAGFFVGRVLAYSRASNSPLNSFWEAEGIRHGGDSILHSIVMTNEEIYQLLEGKLP